ncbi:MAG: hypothetical protein FWD69_18030 [Polyangiaceae bacterium]|nr:hypothetical protein [Polyangiaceae bacterium]
MAAHRVSKIFRSLTALRVLNVLAVGFSLAAATGSVLGSLGSIFGSKVSSAVCASSLATLFYGLLWALALRHRATIGKSSVRIGWLASIPLAMANSATAVVLANALDGSGSTNVVEMAVVGATFGALVWLPALIVTLLCFGLPIAWSQRRANSGLAGEEQGEAVVGAISAIIAICAALLLRAWRVVDVNPDTFNPDTYMVYPNVTSMTVVATIAFIGALTGVLATVFAAWRGRARRTFVREVEAGKITNFRVDTTAAGRVLVRVTPGGEGYRVANFEEPIAVLDDLGNAKQSFANAP